MQQTNILYVGPIYPATASTYLMQAIGECNVAIKYAGPTYNDHYGVDWGRYTKKSDYPMQKEAPEWDIDALVDKATKDGFPVSHVFICEENYRTVIKPTEKVPQVLLSYDGWPTSFERYHMVKPVLAYTPHPYGVRPAPREALDPNWKHLPAAAHPSVHRFTRPVEHRKIDFVLMATPYGKRPQLCEYLDDKCSVMSGLSETSEYVDAYNLARTTYHNCCYQDELKYRFYEAIAMGVVNITDHTRLLDEMGLVDEVHYLSVPITEQGDDPYPNFEDILNRVVAMRNNPNVYRYVARSAYEWLIRGHTYWHRAKQIFDDLELYHKSAFTYGLIDNVRKEL